MVKTPSIAREGRVNGSVAWLGRDRVRGSRTDRAGGEGRRLIPLFLVPLSLRHEDDVDEGEDDDDGEKGHHSGPTSD